MSTRKSILLALKARLEAITVENGYRTDAGQHVTLNEMVVYGDAQDPDAQIAIMVGADTPKWQGDKVAIELPINVQAIVRADLDEPWEAAEDVIADIKKAVEQEDRTLGGLVPSEISRGSTQTLEREPGSHFVGAQIPYIADYTELWGNP